MRRITIQRVVHLALLAALFGSSSAGADGDTDYTARAGGAAGVFENESLNFRLDLEATQYVVVDLSETMPHASFAAMRFDPLVFMLAIVEDLGVEMTTEQYANIVRTATAANLTAGTGGAGSEIEELGRVEVDGIEAIQLGFSGDINGTRADYVITAFAKGRMAYQLTVFATGAGSDALRREAGHIADAFSFIGAGPKRPAVAKRVEGYRSAAFAYEVAADTEIWFPWAGLDDDYPHADTGALGAKGYGAVVLPFCWQGARPTQLALLDVFLEQFGEEYPAAFITQERPIEKQGASGLYLSGTDTADGDDYTYEFWIVANERCAYTLGAWGPAGTAATKTDLAALWDSVRLRDAPGVFDESRGSAKERQINAFFLNQTGMHYYEARSYRESFRFLSQAADLDRSDTTYLMNALRVLSEIDAYREAYDWLQPRLAHYPDDVYVRSWDAWLAYQVDDSDKAVALYQELFAEGYREDGEFRVYLEMLADREQWDTIDAEFDRYAGDELTESLQRLKAELLSRRGRHDEALEILDAMTEGRPFDAELAYAKIEVYDAMGNAAEMLKLADRLIDKNYESLESWFYKGYAEYSLKSYVKSRESFVTALEFAPTNTLIQEYIDAINGILGEGDNASISKEIEAVKLPRDLEKARTRAPFGRTRDGYGAFFLTRMTGFDFDGGDAVTKTHYQQIKVQDAQGIKQFSTLEFNFDPAFESLYVNQLLVRSADGGVVAEADRDAFYVTDTIDGYEASTEQTAHLPVPSLAPGVVIDVVVTTRVGVDKGELPLDIRYLSRSRPVDYSAVFVTGDSDRYRFESFGVGKPRRSGRSTIWEISDPIVYRWEPMLPYFDRILPWVYVGTTSVDWNAAGSEYYAKIGDKLTTERVAETAERLVRGVDDELRKIEILSRYVQKELHYEAIEFGRRAYIPKTARETLRDRYGDCKDHAVLLYALLNAAGIPAQLALVNLRQRVRESLPNVDQFDHMIVSVPRTDGRLFIDATDKDMRLGSIPPRFMAGNKALIIGTSSELVAIPDFEAGDSSLYVDREIERIGDREIRILEVGTFAGYQAAELRGQLREIEPSEIRSTMQTWVADRYKDAIVDDAIVDNLLEADSSLVVELSYRLPIDGGDTFNLPGFLEAEYLDFGRLAERRFGFEPAAPFSVSSITTVIGPGAAKLAVASQKPAADESRFGHWRRRIDKVDDRWVFSLDYTGRKSEFEADAYDDFTEFHRRLVGSIEQPVIME